jgi:transposase
MHEKPIMTTERVDDIPLLLAQMDRMGLAEVLDTHFPTHDNWQGLSLGRVTTIWLRSMLSRGDHRLVHVEPWVAQRHLTLSQITGEAVRAPALSDDRLQLVLRLFSDDTGWTSFASALNQHLVRVYDLQAERVHVDSTSASASASVRDNGVFPFGHSKDHRPDLPQVQVMQAVLDPLGMPLVTEVVSGERADDPLYGPVRRIGALEERSKLLPGLLGDPVRAQLIHA